MTAVSIHRKPGDAKLPTADKQPRHRGPWQTVFLLSVIRVAGHGHCLNHGDGR